MKLSSLRGSLTYCSVLALSMAAFTAAGAFAQETSDKDKVSDDKASDTTEVVVTGSRIRHKGAASATPTTVINAEAIRKSGARWLISSTRCRPW